MVKVDMRGKIMVSVIPGDPVALLTIKTEKFTIEFPFSAPTVRRLGEALVTAAEELEGRQE